MNRACDQRGRRGVTLLELLLTITATTVIMGVAGSLLHRSLRLEAASRGVMQAERTALVLARRFREDVRTARGVAGTTDGLPDGIVLRVQPAAEGEIVYRAVAGSLVREETLPAGRVAREAFAFPAAVRFQAAREAGVVTLMGTGGGEPGEGPPIDIEAVAALGVAGRGEEEQP
jgi:hypothetical protein